MKKNIIFKSLAGVLVAGSLGSCSSDYLDLAPEVDFPTSTVMGTTEAAKYAINGLCYSMNCVYGGVDLAPQISGEASINTLYGDQNSPDWFYNWYALSGVDFMKWEFITRAEYTPAFPAWMYGYNLINQANTILVDIDNAEGPEADRAFIKAQALTMRAHAYQFLLKIYGPRWEDSAEGKKYVLVYRTEPGTGDAPLASMNKVLKLIYDDLDEAIELYTESGKSRSQIWEPNIDIARGVYARAAMLKHDWAKARDMARAARANYPIMTAEEYTSGFYTPNGEWMWANAADENVTGYAGWGSWFACNGGYASFLGKGSPSISYDLYKATDENDCRREYFFTPDKRLPNSVHASDFWEESAVDPETMNMNKVAGFRLAIQAMGRTMMPNGDTEMFLPANTTSTDSGAASDVIVPFGAGFKFWGMGPYTTLSFPFMRASELALYEAEACYNLGDIAGAQKALNDVNSKRIPGYNCTKTGDAFFEEYMISSRMELWGEGQTWFNMKRWNVTAVRNPWIAGNQDSNNMPAMFTYKNGPEVQNGWRWAIPRSEERYNKLCSSTQLEQLAPDGE